MCTTDTSFDIGARFHRLSFWCSTAKPKIAEPTIDQPFIAQPMTANPLVEPNISEPTAVESSFAELTIAKPVPAEPTAPLPSNLCETAARDKFTNFVWSASSVPKTDAIFCGSGHRPDCTAPWCSNILTTVVTSAPPPTEVALSNSWDKIDEASDKLLRCAVKVQRHVTANAIPAAICESFTYPPAWYRTEDTTMRTTGTCDQAACCAVKVPPCNLVVTKPAPSLESFTYPCRFSKNKDDLVCGMGCGKATCCTAIIVMTMTTPAPTCLDSSCTSEWEMKVESIPCARGSCDKVTCFEGKPHHYTTITSTPARACGNATCLDRCCKDGDELEGTAAGLAIATCCAVIITTVTTTPRAMATTTPSEPRAPSVLGLSDSESLMMPDNPCSHLRQQRQQ